MDISLPHPPACRRRNAPSPHASQHGSLAGHVAVLAEIMVRAYEVEGLRVPAELLAACAGSPVPAVRRFRVIPGGSP